MDTSRVLAAKSDAFSTRGPNKGHLKAKCPPMGTDGAIFWQAAMMRCNPYKVGMGHLMFMSPDQREFYQQCEAWVDQQHAVGSTGLVQGHGGLTMSNTTTRNTTIRAVMSSREFLQGFLDVTFSRGWNEPVSYKDQWRYERGRAFAVWLLTKGVDPRDFNIKRGRWATPSAVSKYVEAKREQAVI